MSLALDAENLIKDLAARNPNAAQLAMLFSLASRIEPGVLVTKVCLALREDKYIAESVQASNADWMERLNQLVAETAHVTRLADSAKLEGWVAKFRITTSNSEIIYRSLPSTMPQIKRRVS